MDKKKDFEEHYTPELIKEYADDQKIISAIQSETRFFDVMIKMHDVFVDKKRQCYEDHGIYGKKWDKKKIEETRLKKAVRMYYIAYARYCLHQGGAEKYKIFYELKSLLDNDCCGEFQHSTETVILEQVNSKFFGGEKVVCCYPERIATREWDEIRFKILSPNEYIQHFNNKYLKIRDDLPIFNNSVEASKYCLKNGLKMLILVFRPLGTHLRPIKRIVYDIDEHDNQANIKSTIEVEGPISVVEEGGEHTGYIADDNWVCLQVEKIISVSGTRL